MAQFLCSSATNVSVREKGPNSFFGDTALLDSNVMKCNCIFPHRAGN